MIQPLNELVGLPPTAPPAEIAAAAESQCEALFFNASHSDANAQRELVALHVAYLVWAYARPAALHRVKLQS